MAVECAREALAAEETRGNRFAAAWCVACLAGVAAKTGDAERAALLSGAAEAVREDRRGSLAPVGDNPLCADPGGSAGRNSGRSVTRERASADERCRWRRRWPLRAPSPRRSASVNGWRNRGPRARSR